MDLLGRCRDMSIRDLIDPDMGDEESIEAKADARTDKRLREIAEAEEHCRKLADFLNSIECSIRYKDEEFLEYEKLWDAANELSEHPSAGICGKIKHLLGLQHEDYFESFIRSLGRYLISTGDLTLNDFKIGKKNEFSE